MKSRKFDITFKSDGVTFTLHHNNTLTMDNGNDDDYFKFKQETVLLLKDLLNENVFVENSKLLENSVYTQLSNMEEVGRTKWLNEKHEVVNKLNAYDREKARLNTPG